MFDLGIEGGTVVTPTGRSRSQVYVGGERIATVTGTIEPARRRVDATGLLVMPGMVDAHVHLMDPSAPEREDFPTGTAAAARAGVTTIIEHAHAGPVRTAEELRDKAAYLRNRSRVDFALAAHAWPDRLGDVEPVWRAGAAFIKVFTCTTHGVSGHDPDRLRQLFERTAAAGATCLVHCEDESLTAEAERALRAAGRTDGGVIPTWRSREAELAAVAVTAMLARQTGAKVVIAHASHPEALEVADRERRAGGCLTIESCPQYLTLLEAEVLEKGAFRKFTPPARARNVGELEAMWQGLASGTIDYISSDHAPSTQEQKREGSIWDVHFGLPGIDTTLPVLFDGAHSGRLSYERVVEVYAEAPARTYGLHARKGRLEPGADADVILVDPELRWTVRDEDIISKARWSPYTGRTLLGRTIQTYLRGALIAEEGKVLASPGVGRFLAGPGVMQKNVRG